MSEQKLITVLGATGTQGGAVARALLADGEFAVRAVTRNAASQKAEALAELGTKVVEATLTDEGSLRKAFAGAYGHPVLGTSLSRPGTGRGGQSDQRRAVSRPAARGVVDA